MISVLFHFLVGIAVVGGLLWALSRLAKGGFASLRARTGGGDALRVVCRRQVSKGAVLVRVSVEDKDLLLGSTPKGIELLCELPKSADPLPAAQPIGLFFGDDEPGSFAELLGKSFLAHRRR
jgi:flagellar biogenesis protein FliO